jgi:hypothetical protein
VLNPVVDVHPADNEVAVIHLPKGVSARVHHPNGLVREMHPADVYAIPDLPLIVTVTGDAEAIGWGATVCRYLELRPIRNYRHRSDRPAWEDAAKAVSRGGVAYVQYEQVDYHGKPRWTAVGIRTDEKTSP